MRAVFTGIVLALILVHYIELIAGAAVLGWTQSLLAMAMFLVGILLTRQNQRYYALAIMSTGAIIFFLRPFTGTPLFDGFRQLNMMVGTLMLVPVLGVLFDLRGYVYALLGLATRYLKRPPFFLSALAVLSNLVSAMLLVGCLPLIYHLVEKVAEGDESGLRQRLLTVSILQGCSCAGLWSPSWVLVAMSLSIGTRGRQMPLRVLAGCSQHSVASATCSSSRPCGTSHCWLTVRRKNRVPPTARWNSCSCWWSSWLWYC